MRITLTDELINHGLQCPEDRKHIELVHTDPLSKGLLAEVARGTPGRAVYRWRFKHRATGKTTYVRIGSTDEVSLAEALAKATSLRQRLDAGLEPVVEEKPKPTMPTLTRFFEDDTIPYLKTRKRGWEKDQQRFNYRLKAEFGDMKLDEITRQHAQSYLTRLIEKEKLAPATANHHVKLLRQVLNIALDWEVISKNPVAKVRLLPENNKVEVLLTDEQLSRLIKTLKTYPSRNTPNVALFLLATGARLSEALNAKWEHIDRKNRVWRIPAANSKSKKAGVAPLNDAALEVLDQLGSEGKHEYLFVKSNGERFRYLHQVWGRIRKQADLPKLRVHDLRHIHASLVVGAGRSLYEVQAILRHSDPSQSARYSHIGPSVLQDASREVSKAITAAIQRNQ